MLEKFIIFSRTGVVLFSLSFSALKADPIPALIRDSLLTQHVPRGIASFDYADYNVKWTEAALQEVVFAAVLDRAVAAQVRYIETLLASVKDVFLQKYGAGYFAEPNNLSAVLPATSHRNVDDGLTEDVFGFKALFDGLLDAAEKSAGGAGGLKAMRSAGTSKGAGALASAPVVSTPVKDSSDEDADTRVPRDSTNSGAGDADDDDDGDDDKEMAAARAALMSRMASKGSKGGLGSKRGTPVSSGKGAGSDSARGVGKAGSSKSLSLAAPNLDFKYSKELEKSLDRAAGSSGDSSAAAAAVERVEYRYDGSTGKDLDDSDADMIAAATAAALAGGAGGAAGGAGASSSSSSSSSSASGGGLFSSAASWLTRSKAGTFLSSLTGNKVLDRADLEPAMEGLKQQLIGRNVAREAADALCESVMGTLEGKKLEVAGSVAATVGAALTSAIERILTPRRPIDLLAEVRAKKSTPGAGPYVVVLVGVNGVGKSTSLSKVAYHLKDNRHSVLIAACDSFRAGAVEQLKRHCTALDIPLFEQGYAIDPVAIAAAAIKEASAAGTDVVLVDTAGRMQNNAGLMQQLARLVAVNKPDLVLFVGEALVGNDGVDQLSEFNKKLVEYAADRTNPRRIDGIMLTKFDTIDDNVGAALSMVYSTGIPVIFLGTGQKYTDLRRLNVGAVVKALMS